MSLCSERDEEFLCSTEYRAPGSAPDVTLNLSLSLVYAMTLNLITSPSSRLRLSGLGSQHTSGQQGLARPPPAGAATP